MYIDVIWFILFCLKLELLPLYKYAMKANLIELALVLILIIPQLGAPLSISTQKHYWLIFLTGGDVDCQRDSLRFRYEMQQQLSALTTEGSHSTVKDGNLEGLPQSTADTSYRVIMKEGEESEVVSLFFRSLSHS